MTTEGGRGSPALGLAVVVFVAPFALGGTRAAVQVGLAAAVGLAVVWHAARGGRLRPPPVLWWLLVPAAWGIVQCLAGVSLDPPATVVATLHQTAFAAVALLAASAGRRERRLVRGALLAAVTGVAALGLAQWLTGAEQIFWSIPALHRPALGGYFATFVNPNTLAGFLVLGAVIALGAAVETERRGLYAVAALAAGGAVLTGSRSGQVALLVALIAFAVLARRGEGQTRPALLALALGVVAVAAAVVWLPDWRADPGLDGRLAVAIESVQYIIDHDMLGSGRGTFEYVFPGYALLARPETVTHPETIGIQLVAEWGAPVAAVAIGAGVVAWVQAARRAGRHAGRWGLCAGLLAVGLQQLTDFGFEAMGLSLPVAAALGLALADDSRAEHAPRMTALVAVPVLVGALTGIWAVIHHADRDGAWVEAAATPADLEARAAAATARHPADPQIPLIAAARLAALGAPLDAVLPHLNRAMARAPHDGRPHLLAARLLRAAGRSDQAAVEYRFALTELPWRRGALIREIATLTDPAHLAAALPRPDRRAYSDERAALAEVLFAADRAADVRAMADHLLSLDPDALDAHHLRGRALLALGDLDGAARTADGLLDRRDIQRGERLRARIALARGDAAAARAAVAAAFEADPEGVAPLWLRADVAAATRDLVTARATYDLLWRRVAADPAEAAAVLAAWGRLERHAGDAARGARMLRQAAALDPQYADEAAQTVEIRP